MLPCRNQSQINLLGTLLLTLATLPANARDLTLAASFKDTWGQPTTVGSVDKKALPEASGIAASQLVLGRLYHINDAGNSPAFVVTNEVGENAQTVALDGVDTIDTEEVAVGACPLQSKDSCIYIADIGDNDFARSDIKLYIVKERSQFSSHVAPDLVVTLQYPDGDAHNAESLAIHPDGWLYLLTKEVPAQLHRLPLSSISGQRTAATLEFIGTLDFKEWLEGTDKPNRIIPTAMAIHPRGDQVVILTRSAGVSFNMDFVKDLGKPNGSPMDLNETFQAKGIAGIQLPKTNLPQTEAVTYIDNGTAILISSEVKDGQRKKKPRPSQGGVPLVRIDSLR